MNRFQHLALVWQKNSNALLGDPRENRDKNRGKKNSNALLGDPRALKNFK